ncbi:RDD family protein [Williamwhitmania taraxaci]|uniref:Uncharacterized membrane protein YckC, RDD family n=1 Tax=Williamwhitmania taraxaci TaxID=1640674 RepID=A0A1G6GRS4_9BACT|nr:RDD family protein [Williamwhitmania taraxaci]SDB84742.1 Uncharacterized membrane protein YckC, RDD family [Williamwhitmania taraxaci]
MELIEKTEPKYAGFWLRFVANIIDQLLLQTVIVIFTLPLIFGMVTGIITASKEQGDASKAIAIISVVMGFVALLFAVSLIVGWLYYAIMESSKQQGTLGKMALGIKVTDIEGNKITFTRATGRYFGKIISNMTIYIGYIMAGFTVKKQALHDIIADCLVIKKDN